MPEDEVRPYSLQGVRTPSEPPYEAQPWWNRQRGSAMPFERYRRLDTPVVVDPAQRLWPSRTVGRAPLWCSVDLRDGNQALARPMGVERKLVMFDLLVRMGFKEIEVGYPSASEADFEFARTLVTGRRIPADVTISVFTPARPELIDRTYEAIDGVDQALVHLCNATAPLWRDVVYSMSRPEVKALATSAAEQVLRLAESRPESRLRFEYSPETFNLTELEFSLEVCNEVAAVWGASPARPVTLNLPTTVETDSPNVFADQVEWMHRNLDNRSGLILSVHPHNDRGTAVASAELALAAGADRVEGTLFGNGERTGNVCLATLALNLFSRGVDPQLDFSDIDTVRRVVEYCNQLPVPDRHPYVGDLVYTAFAGTHQDAIRKGMLALEHSAARAEVEPRGLAWCVPYLPVDPGDVGRSYEAVVRINSQSGKGGAAYVLRQHFGLDLPRQLQVECYQVVQSVAEAAAGELTPQRLWDLFRAEYVERQVPLRLVSCRAETTEAGRSQVEASILADGQEIRCSGAADTVAEAFIDGLRNEGYTVELCHFAAHDLLDGNGSVATAAYARIGAGDVMRWGVGIEKSAAEAAARAILAALNRGLSEARSSPFGEPSGATAGMERGSPSPAQGIQPAELTT